MPIITMKALRETGKQKLFVIPYLFTYLNAFFGFLSIIKTLDGDFVAAAYCIMLAACMDFFDGRLARAFGSSSCLGMELDSLCDAVSFCLAPTILLYSWHLYAFGFAGIAILSLYLCSGLYRLAKFNTSSDAQQAFFLGLPTTVAAFFFAHFVVQSSWISGSSLQFFLSSFGISFLILLISLLMISSVRYVTLKQRKFVVTPVLSCILALAVTGIVFVTFVLNSPLLFLMVCVYLLSGLFFEILSFMLRFLF